MGWRDKDKKKIMILFFDLALLTSFQFTSSTQFVFFFLARRAWASLFFLRLLLSWLCWGLRAAAAARQQANKEDEHSRLINSLIKKTIEIGLWAKCWNGMKWIYLRSLMEESKANQWTPMEWKQRAPTQRAKREAASQDNSTTNSLFLAGAGEAKEK